MAPSTEIVITAEEAVRLDSWLSALRYGRVIPGAYRTMHEDDQFELDALCKLVRSWSES